MQKNKEKRKQELTQSELKKALHYDPDTGHFTWIDHRNVDKISTRAGLANRDGYLQINVNRTMYGAHRLAWLYEYGEFPNSGIDHINGDPADNRIANLRIANQAENMQNIAMYKSNKSGYMGVHFHKRNKKYQATIKAYGKQKHLGYFDTAELAFEAYKEAKKVLHSFNPEMPTRCLKGVT